MKTKRSLAVLLVAVFTVGLLSPAALATVTPPAQSEYSTPNLPPQVIISNPDQKIEIPPEDVPIGTPGETEDFDESELVIFEDEEIPITVPETGDTALITPLFTLLTLAGAAFALTSKKSREKTINH